MIALNGKMVQKGSSPLKEKTGEQILSDKFTLEDTRLRDWRPASSPCDGEGIPGKHTVLFNRGRLDNFIFDLQTAGILGETSTGNASRGYSDQPQPGFANLIVAPGDRSVASMISPLRDGLIIYSCLGGGQSNLLAGDFSLNAHLAFRIRNGEIAGRIKDSMVSGNVYEVFKNIDCMSAEREERGRCLLPYIQFSGVQISR
jgi:PmbA protein